MITSLYLLTYKNNDSKQNKLHKKLKKLLFQKFFLDLSNEVDDYEGQTPYFIISISIPCATQGALINSMIRNFIWKLDVYNFGVILHRYGRNSCDDFIGSQTMVENKFHLDCLLFVK